MSRFPVETAVTSGSVAAVTWRREQDRETHAFADLGCYHAGTLVGTGCKGADGGRDGTGRWVAR